MQNRTFGSWIAALHRALIPVLWEACRRPARGENDAVKPTGICHTGRRQAACGRCESWSVCLFCVLQVPAKQLRKALRYFEQEQLVVREHRQVSARGDKGAQRQVLVQYAPLRLRRCQL
jgi:hypothetical protein